MLGDGSITVIYLPENCCMHWIMDMFRWIVEIVLRPTEIEGLCSITKALGCRTNIIAGLTGVGD